MTEETLAKNMRVFFKTDVTVAAPESTHSKMDHYVVKAGTTGTITEISPYVVVSLDTGDAGLRKQIAWHSSTDISAELAPVPDRPQLVAVK